MKTVKIHIQDNISDIFLIKKNEEGIDVFFKDGELFTGKIEIYGYQDRIEMRGTFKEGKRYDKFIHYYPNGQEKIVEYYSENGKRNGNYKFYYETGILQTEGVLENEKKTGHWKWYYPTGIIENEVNYEIEEIINYKKYLKTGILIEELYDNQGFRFSRNSTDKYPLLIHSQPNQK